MIKHTVKYKEAGRCRTPCGIVCWDARQSGMPGDTSTLTDIDHDPWMEALWTGMPWTESPTVGMQIDQPQTTERHETKSTHATDFQDRVPAD